MALASWPTGLPHVVSQEGLTYTPVDNAIRSGTETGPGKVRRRFTGKHEKVTFTLSLTAAQRVTFNTFYATTLKQVLPFLWKDHRTATTATYRFLKPPTEKYLAGDVDTAGGWWAVQIELELIA